MASKVTQFESSNLPMSSAHSLLLWKHFNDVVIPLKDVHVCQLSMGLEKLKFDNDYVLKMVHGVSVIDIQDHV